MQTVQDGQCGLCEHFGEEHQSTAALTEVRTKHSAPEAMIDECGHPKHAPLHLKVTAISSCDGFSPARQN